MKLGFVSAILDGWTFEEMMDTAAGLGYECVEAACWPQGKAERRYAGVSHIDVDNDSRGYVAHIHETCKKTGFDNVNISQATSPPITTINQPKYQMGYMACELLIEKLNTPGAKPRQVLLNTELIIRESTQRQRT